MSSNGKISHSTYHSVFRINDMNTFIVNHRIVNYSFHETIDDENNATWKNTRKKYMFWASIGVVSTYCIENIF